MTVDSSEAVVLSVRWALAHGAALALLLIAAASAGARVVSRLTFANRFEHALFAIMAGLGVWAAGLFLVGLAGGLYRVPLVIVTVVVAAQGLWQYRGCCARAVRAASIAIRTASRTTQLAGAAIVFVTTAYWLILLAAAQYPPMLWDSIAYHLVLVRTYLDQHRIVPVPGVVFPVLPALQHCLFAWAMALSDDVLAQTLEQTLMMLTALGLVAWGVRSGSKGVGLAAAALWIGHPLVLAIAESAYVDVGAAAFVFFGVYALRVVVDGDRRWWPLAALLFGVAAGIKSPGLAFLAIAGALAILEVMRRRLSARAFAAGVAIAAVAVVPTYAFVAWHAGNPLWPTSVIHTEGAWRHAAEAFWPRWGSVGVTRTVPHFLELPFLIVFRPDPFYPDAGRHFLAVVALFPLAWAASIVNRSVRWWTAWCLIYLFVWFESSQQLRFLIVIMPMLSLAICESMRAILMWLRARTWLRALVWSATAATALVCGARVTAVEIDAKGWPPPVSEGQRRRFLEAHLGGFAAAEFVNDARRDGERVFVVNAAWLPYYIDAETRGRTLLSSYRAPTFSLPADGPLLADFDRDRVNWIILITDDVKAESLRRSLCRIGTEVWPGYHVVIVYGTTAVIRRTAPSRP